MDYFTLTIDPVSGAVTLDLLDNIWHDNTADADDSEVLKLAENALLLTQTVTDGDGDSDSASIDLGAAGAFSFEDDGPQACIHLKGPWAQVVHDESAGQQNFFTSWWKPGDWDNDVSSASVFDGVSNKGSDIDPAGFARSLTPIVGTFGSSYGADGKGSTVLSLELSGAQGSDSGLRTTDGKPINLYLEGALIVGRVASGDAVGPAAFAVAIGGDGSISVAQYMSLKHPAGGSSYDEAVNLIGKIKAVVTVTDGDGDVAVDKVSIGHVIGFEDDGPLASVKLIQGAVVVHDESHALQNASATPAAPEDANDHDSNGVSGLFNSVVNRGGDLSPKGYAQSNGPLVSTAGSSYGQDQEGATSKLSLAIVGGNGVDSGRTTTAGFTIKLYMENDLVVGRIVGGPDNGKAAFAVAISADGTISVAQYVSLQHPTGGSSYDEAISLAGKVQAVLTVTDGDGDVAIDKVQIGSAIRFEDDGPSANINLKGPWVDVTHDETAGLQNFWTTWTPGDIGDDDVAFLSAFNGVANKGTDITPTGYAKSTTPVVTTQGSSYGEDEEGATTQLSLLVKNGNGTDSGLKTTDGHTITLHLEGALVVGRIVGGGDTGKAAFAIAIGADGSLSLAQYVSLRHSLGGSNYDDAETLAGKILAVVTVTDGDDDVAVDTVDIGSVIRFEDDGPTACISLVRNASVTHDESAGLQNAVLTPSIVGDADDNDVADLSALFSGVMHPGTDLGTTGYAQSATSVVSTAGSSVGQDEEGATSVLSLALQGSNGQDSGLKTTDGFTIRLSVEGSLVVGRVDGGSENGKAAFAVAIGSDGKLSVAQYISIQHLDSGSADEARTLSGKIKAVLTITDGDGDVAVDKVDIGHVIRFEDDAPSAGQTTAALVLDDEGLLGGINGGPADTLGAATSTSGNLVFAAGADGLKSLALSGPATLGTETVSSSWDAVSHTLTISSSRGSLVTVVLTNPATGAYTINLLKPLMHPASGTEDNITLNIGYKVTDGDNDTATGSLVVSIDDDTPTIQAGYLSTDSFVTYHGTDASYANSYGYYIKGADGTPQTGKVIWANVQDQVDGDTSSLAGLNPAQVGFFIIPNGGANSGLINGAELTFQQVAGKWTAFLGSTALTGDLGANVLFSDAALNPGGSHLQDNSGVGNQNWEDVTTGSDYDYNDVSTNVTWGSGLQLQVDETRLDIDVSANFSGVFNVQPGADGLQRLSYQFDVNDSDSGLVDTLTNQAVMLSVNESGVLEGRTAGSGELVFKLSVDTAGKVTLDQQRAIFHNTVDPDEARFLGLGHISLTATVLDKDGDSANASIDLGAVISFRDDGPRSTPNSLVQLDDDDLPAGLPGGTGDDGVSPLQGILGHDFGADRAGSVQLLESGTAPAGFSYVKDGDDLLIKQGSTDVLRIELDIITGEYRVIQLAAIRHEAGNNENNIGFTLNYRVTDKDGDYANGMLQIDVDDDTPTASHVTAAKPLDDEGLPGGINGGDADVAEALTSISGSLGYSAGADGLKSIVLSGPLSLGSEAVTSTWHAATNTLSISSVRGLLVNVTLTNPATGAYTVNLLKPLMHPVADTEDNITLNIGYRVTDGDDDHVDGSLVVTIDDDTPTIQAGNIDTGSYVTFYGTDAGYANSYGYYIKGPDGSPISGKVIWANVHDQEAGDTASLNGLDPNSVGFFIIPNGGVNPGLANNTDLTFKLIEGKWTAMLGGNPLTGADGANVLFSAAGLNPGGSHLQDTSNAGNQNWEDKTETSDYDYNDVSTSVTWGSSLQVDESNFDVDAKANFNGVFNVQAGADGLKKVDYELTVQTTTTGLVDTLTNKPVVLGVNPAGVIEGRAGTNGELVFTLSVDAGGTVTLNQVRAVMHPTGDANEAKFLGAGYVSLKATVTDGDGDTRSANLDIGKVVSFRDDGPLAVDDNPTELVEGSAAASQVSGSVLDNDAAGNDGGKVFVAWDNAANGAAIAELARYGTLVLNHASGGYSFVLDNSDTDVINLLDGQTIAQSLKYSMRDADGDISTAKLTITIVGNNSAPEISVDPVSNQVFEAGLDGSGTEALSSSEFAVGTFKVSDPDGLSEILAVTINGQEILIGALGTNNPIIGNHGTLTITAYDTETGVAQYRYELTERTENVPGPEQDEFTLTTRDASETSAPAKLTIDIVDDVPIAKDNSICVPETGLPPFSVTLIIDRSSSMSSLVEADIDGDGDLDTVSRLQVAKQALVNLIDSYVSLGVPVNFNLIGFSSNASMLYEGSNAAAAKAAILDPGLSPNGTTNYEAALNLAKSDLEDELSPGGEYLPGYQHKVYFLSDGEPYPSSNDAPASWKPFVDSNGIDVIAVGIQIPDGSDAEGELKEVANGTEEAVLVQNPDELSAALDATVPDPVTGNLITDVDAVAGADLPGADGPVTVTHISFIVADASAYQDGSGNDADSVANLGAGQFLVTYKVEGGTTGLIDTPKGGLLKVAGDGTYTYSAPANVAGDSQEVFTYSVKDTDGSSSEAKLTVCIEDGAPVARNNTVSVEESGLRPFSLTLILDRSGSMDDDVIKADLDGDGTLENTTRLQVAKQALVNLIDSYAALGDLGLLNINFIAFSENASLRYEGNDLLAAKQAILDGSLGASGSTNYAAALNMARSEIEDEMTPGGSEYLAGYQHKVYFLSDGEPNPSSADAPDDWQSFVDGNGIDVIAVGIQIPDGSDAENELKEVANAREEAVLVQNPAELSAALGETVPGTIDGNVILDVDSVAGKDLPGNDLPVTLTQINFAVDNANLTLLAQYQGQGATLVVGSTTTMVTFNVPANGSDLIIETPLGGTLSIDKTGSYHYSSPGNVVSGVQEVITYTIADSDGDASSADLIINVTDSVPLAVNDVRSLNEGHWAVGIGNDLYSAVFEVDGSWSVTPVSQSLTGGDISNTPNGGQKSSDSSGFTVVADTAHPVEIRFNATVNDFNSADRWQAQVFKVGSSSPVAELLGQTGSVANKTIGGITESGAYYVRFTVFDNSTSNRADLDISRFSYSSYSYTQPSTQTVNVTAPALMWVAAMLSGNLLANDQPGADAGLKVTAVDGVAVVVGGVSIAGDYGTLQIASNGQYTYTQHQQDYHTGASDSFFYSIVDADGSTSSAILTINLVDHNYPATASNSSDFIGGEDVNDTLNGLNGNDIVYGGAGNDTLSGGSGNDHLVGGAGDDILNGNDNNDILEGGAGDDQLYGGAGSDALLGGAGNDNLLGDADDDILIGGLGNDTLTGGAGKDAYVWRAGEEGGVDRVFGFSVDINGIGSDMLDLSDLLSGLPDQPGASALSSYLSFGFASGSTTISVDKAGDGGAVDQTIVLEGVDLSSSAYYGSADTAAIISGMLDDNALKVA
ncbi:hypothetical protein DBR41_12965 [Pseudomonas sp. HMWF010]|nr:hypothetical protein DBR41_12965 [Pseudomonas sp. HMWF010]